MTVNDTLVAEQAVHALLVALKNSGASEEYLADTVEKAVGLIAGNSIDGRKHEDHLIVSSSQQVLREVLKDL